MAPPKYSRRERYIGLPEPPIDACKEWQDQSFSLPPI
jgi:hypothetical protein